MKQRSLVDIGEISPEVAFMFSAVFQLRLSLSVIAAVINKSFVCMQLYCVCRRRRTLRLHTQRVI